MDSKLDAIQDTLDQILNAMHRQGARPAVLPLLPFSAMTGPYPPRSGTTRSGTSAVAARTVASTSSTPPAGATSQSAPAPPAGQQQPWYPNTPLKPPSTFTGDKKDEALDTWLRTVSMWVRAKRTLVEEEVITAASYLEGSAARWLNRLVASKGFGRNMNDWAKTRTLESFMDLVEARWHNPQQAQIATDGLLRLDTKYKSVRELTSVVERLMVVPGTQINPSTTLTRWLHEIDVYDFELKHKKGCYNLIADALFRHPEYMTCLVGSYDLRKTLKKELIEHTAKDQKLSPILEQVQADPSSQPDFHECKGLLFQRYEKYDQLCVPNHEPVRTHFMAHGRSGHFGFEKTYGSLLQKFVRPGMKEMAQKFVVECEVCQRIKPSRQKPYGLLHHLPIPDGPGESLSIEFADMGKKSRNGYSQVMVIVDHFAKFLNLIPLPPHAATDLVIKKFHKKYILQCGPPKTLVSDQDTRFISADWKDFTSQVYDTTLKMTSGRHPEANGLAEEKRSTRL
ncbi:hypothetical protein CBR_g4072 [Chara braunii]|uniref:Integrase catalytic domain-containing protein n=1 Tax=Chara braunii TaxID=69332 RepID=A0A388KH60_CHABU|nr:hypothetical protein CBR_g4072 [Chara braunii]|eukprot:GBG69379.1 hypothetical protein CBR_g4072 [Chara braunii]